MTRCHFCALLHVRTSALILSIGYSSVSYCNRLWLPVKMYTFIKYFALCSILYLSHAAEEDVLELVDSDFATTLQSHETTLVMFYAPWCGHCKRLKPEYAQAAGILSRDDPPITLAKVDCTEGGKGSCEKYSVSGYPTLKIFRNGEMSQEYNGPRESAGIVKYMRAQVGPSSKELTTLEEYEAFIGKDEVAVIGFFAEETDLKGDFLKAADKLREEVRFAHSTNSAVLAKAGFKNHIVLYRPKHLQNKFEDSNVIFPGDTTETPIKVFIKDNIHGLVGHRQKDNIGDFKNPLIVAYYGVDYVKNLKGTNYWRNRVLKVAKEFPSLNFAISNKDEFTHELNEFGIDFVKGEKPIVLGRDAAGNKFIMHEEFDVEKLHKFAEDLLDGNLEAFVKSEPVPESNEGPVTIAVGKNFQDVVMNNNKDTLIEFYAPWCGHCQKLSPVWDELGEKMKDEDVAIVKMDATANDWPKSLFEVSGFPTLYWKPKDNSKPVRYNGGRSLDDFIKYIAEHSSSGLKGWDKKGNVKKEEL